MELAFTGTFVGLVTTFLFLGVVGLIFYFRKKLNSYNVVELRKNHQTDTRGKLITERTKFQETDGFRLSGSFLNFGLLTSVVLVLLAFNWTTNSHEIYMPDGVLVTEEILEMEPPPPVDLPPPPPPPPPPIIEKLLEDMIETDQPDFVDQSVDKETEVKASFRPTLAPATLPPPPPDPEAIFVIVEDMPRFPGCEDLASKKEKEECAQKKMLEFIYAHIKYPPIARNIGLEGTTVISFVVEKDGSVNNIKVMRDIGAGCGDEALRVVELMNINNLKWTPAKQRGNAVRVQFNLPVKFKLK